MVAVALVIGAAVADSLRGGSSSTADRRPPPEEVEALLPQEEVAQIGNRWAQGFADNSRDCRYMTQPLCERVACERPGPVRIPGCKLTTQAFRKSFAAATVQEVVFRRDRVAARFTNDEVVELWGNSGSWLVAKLGAKTVRDLFEMNGVRHYLMTPQGEATLYWRTLRKEPRWEFARQDSRASGNARPETGRARVLPPLVSAS